MKPLAIFMERWACPGRYQRDPGLARVRCTKPSSVFIRVQMASLRFDCGVVVAVELHAQLNALPTAFQAMPIGVA